MLFQDKFPVPKRPEKKDDWLDSWRDSYHYDRLEVWAEREKPAMFEAGYVNSYASRRRYTLEAVLTACPAPARVLDLASAQGNFSIALAGLGYQVTWNDLRSELVDYVRMKIPAGAELEFVAGNIFDLGESHLGKYDVVLATEVIEHVAHPDEFVGKLASLVRPGGAIVLSTPNGGYFLNTLPRFSECADPSVYEEIQFKPNSDGHIFLLHEDEMRSFAASAGLTMESLQLITNPLTSGHLKSRFLLGVLPQAVVRGLEGMTLALPVALRRRLLTHLVCTMRKPA
jgi:2-polyprenyl-3-methyl-5-hydroxy-6-metoxy-1,4-benzoquinol methylase